MKKKKMAKSPEDAYKKRERYGRIHKVRKGK
jgi:hypothetical protein